MASTFNKRKLGQQNTLMSKTLSRSILSKKKFYNEVGMVKSFATYDCKSVHGYCPTSKEGSLFV